MGAGHAQKGANCIKCNSKQQEYIVKGTCKCVLCQKCLNKAPQQICLIPLKNQIECLQYNCETCQGITYVYEPNQVQETLYYLYSEKTQKIHSSQNQIENTRKETQEQKQEIKSDSSERQKQLIYEKKLELDEEIKKLKEQIEDQSKQFKQIDEQNKQLLDEKKKMQQEIQNLQSDNLEEQVQSYNISDEEIKKLKEQIEEQSKQFKQIDEQNKQLLDEKKKMKQEIQNLQSDNLEEQVESYNEQIDVLNQDVVRLQKEQQTLRVEKEQALKENKQSQEQLAEKSNQIQNLIQENKQIQEQLADKSNQIQNFIQQSQDALIQMKKHIEEIQILTQEKENSQLEILKLKEQIKLLTEQTNIPPVQFKQINSRKALKNLAQEYKNNSNIQSAISQLSQKYSSYRIVRGDGNCYFRAVGFSYLEHLTRFSTPNQHLDDFINKLESKIGYYQIRSDSSVTQQLRNSFMDLLYNLNKRKQQNDDQIQLFLTQQIQDNQNNLDEALVWTMRFLTANYLESHQDYFQPFSEKPYEEIIKDVLKMGQDAEGIAIGPLQIILMVKIQIETIDRNYDQPLQFDQMKIEGKCPLIYILYKPGHYDIIYSREQTNADGFDENSEQFSNQRVLPSGYIISNPGTPFFIDLPPIQDKMPKQEFKQFKIQFDFKYQSTPQQSVPVQQGQLQKCENCQMEFEQSYIVELQCYHLICKGDLQDSINMRTGQKIILNNNEAGRRPICLICQRNLTEEEIEKAVGREKYEEAKRQANLRLRQ